MIQKVFRAVTWENGKHAKVYISWKTKSGETKKLVKEYKEMQGKPALKACMESVIKHWPGFNPSKHFLTIGAGREYKRGDTHK